MAIAISYTRTGTEMRASFARAREAQTAQGADAAPAPEPPSSNARQLSPLRASAVELASRLPFAP